MNGNDPRQIPPWEDDFVAWRESGEEETARGLLVREPDHVDLPGWEVWWNLADGAFITLEKDWTLRLCFDELTPAVPLTDHGANLLLEGRLDWRAVAQWGLA